jgi:hypothetical protein
MQTKNAAETAKPEATMLAYIYKSWTSELNSIILSQALHYYLLPEESRLSPSKDRYIWHAVRAQMALDIEEEYNSTPRSQSKEIYRSSS